MNNNLIRESANGFNTVSVEATLLSERKMFLTEEVSRESCRILLQQLIFFKEEDPDAEVVLYINCPGGSVYDGLAVYDVMRMMNVRTVCIGTAGSMGSIFFLAGNEREMLPHSRVMIHDPSLNGGSYAGQKPHQLQHVVDDLTKTRDLLCEIIKERSGKPLEKIKELTKEDTFFTAKEALEFGLATKIIESF